MTKLDFSDDDRYVEMCSQAIDKDNNIRAEHSEDIIVVWDIFKACGNNFLAEIAQILSIFLKKRSKCFNFQVKTA